MFERDWSGTFTRRDDPPTDDSAVPATTADPDIANLASTLLRALRQDRPGMYSSLSPVITGLWAQIGAERGEPGFIAVMGTVLRTAIRQYWAAPPTRDAALLSEARRWHDRILANLRTGRTEAYARPTDQLKKDLAVALGRAAAVEAWLVCEGSPGRRPLLQGGPATLARNIPLLAGSLLGRRRWLSGFLNAQEKDRFCGHGAHRLLATVADLLAADRALAGFYLGPSWLYDPALETVSPRLGYHLELARASGGRLFFSHEEGAKSWALNRSETRRRAFEEGRYDPKAYLLLWPRRALIDWASHPMVDRIGPAPVPAQMSPASGLEGSA